MIETLLFAKYHQSGQGILGHKQHDLVLVLEFICYIYYNFRLTFSKPFIITSVLLKSLDEVFHLLNAMSFYC